MAWHVLVLATFIGLSSAGSRVMFEESGIFIKLHSGGIVNLGYIHELEGSNYDSINVLNLYFRQLRFLDPSNNDLFVKQNPQFDVDSKRFYTFRQASVHGMSMGVNMTSLGVVLKLSAMIFKEDAQLQTGAHTLSDVTKGDVMVSLEVTPAYHDVTDDDAAVCIACDLGDGHVIQFEIDVTHSGSAETDDVVHSLPHHQRKGYADGASLYVPDKVLLDGEPYEANTRITESENKHNMIFRLPAPLGNSMEVDLLFDVNLEQNAQLDSDPEQEAEVGDGEEDGEMGKDVYAVADYPRSPGEVDSEEMDLSKDEKVKLQTLELDLTTSRHAEYVVAASTDTEGAASAVNACFTLILVLSCFTLSVFY